MLQLKEKNCIRKTNNEEKYFIQSLFMSKQSLFMSYDSCIFILYLKSTLNDLFSRHFSLSFIYVQVIFMRSLIMLDLRRGLQ